MAQTESSNAKAESTRLKQLLDKMQNENRSLKANLEAHREKCGKMRNEAAGFEASIQALRAKLKATEIELRERQSELEASEAAVTDLVLELAEGKRLNECLRTEKGEENTNGLEEELLRIPESIKMSVNGMLFTEHPRDDQEKFVAGACEIVASPFLNQRSVPEERERCSDNYELASAETQGTVVEGSGESERNIVSNVEVLTRFSKKDCSTSEIGQDVLSNEIADATKLTTYSDRTNAMYDKETSDDRNVAKTWSLDSMEEHIHSWPRSWHANDGLSRYGGRDAIGYGVNVPKPMWPNMAKVALNFVINFEEGGERCILHGDGASKRQLSSLARAEPVGTDRHLDMESLYDYGSRSGFWRLHRLFASKQITCTVFAVGMALERNPQACQAMKQAGWEVASHGYRLADYNVAAMDIEKQHIDRTIGIHQKLIGDAPAGMFLGTPSPSTRGLVSKKFYYDSDSYSDELPFWTLENGSPHLVIPSTMNLSDTRFLSNGFGNAQDFFRHLTETLE
jgi:peptidoglycan/xylan/chitin deacetylase (PgdA/CDA1 family)